MEGTVEGKTAAFSYVLLQLYAQKDPLAVVKRFFESLRGLIEYEGADFYYYEKETQQYVRLFSDRCIAEEKAPLEEMGIPADFVQHTNSVAFRDSDMHAFTKETGKMLAETFYTKNRFLYGMHLLLAQEERQIGVLNLYRTVGESEFSKEEMMLCNLLKEHLALHLYGVLSQSSNQKYTISEVVEQYGLTPRETQVLKGMLDGKENYRIAEEMSISTYTIKKHIMNIYKKLDICSRTQLFKTVKEVE